MTTMDHFERIEASFDRMEQMLIDMIRQLNPNYICPLPPLTRSTAHPVPPTAPLIPAAIQPRSHSTHHNIPSPTAPLPISFKPATLPAPPKQKSPPASISLHDTKQLTSVSLPYYTPAASMVIAPTISPNHSPTAPPFHHQTNGQLLLLLPPAAAPLTNSSASIQPLNSTSTTHQLNAPLPASTLPHTETSPNQQQNIHHTPAKPTPKAAEIPPEPPPLRLCENSRTTFLEEGANDAGNEAFSTWEKKQPHSGS